MTAPTIILATLSVIGHCVAIFWPRKPLKEPLDEHGFPVLWCNNNDKQQNIARVWSVATEQPARPLQEDDTERRSA